MATTQSEDPNEKVDHPRHYNQHKSKVETIELIEHLPCNFANAAKYVWRCGLKQSEKPLRDLGSAMWYVKREQERVDHFELECAPVLKTDVVWRSLARKVIKSDPDSLLGAFLFCLLRYDFAGMIGILEQEIQALQKAGSR